MTAVEQRQDAPSAEPGSEDVAALAIALGQVDAAHRRLRTRIARELGLTVTDLTALIVTSDSSDITPKALAAELGHTSGTITALIDRLSAAGYMSRTPKPGDRRSLLIALTPQGIATINDVWERYVNALTVAAQTSPHLVDKKLLNSLKRAAEVIDESGQYGGRPSSRPKSLESKAEHI